MKQRYIFLFLMSCSFLQACSASSNMLIRIYSTKSIANVRLLIDFGKYNIVTDGKEPILPNPLTKGEYVDIKNNRGKLQIELNGKVLQGSYKELKLHTSGFKNIVRVVIPGKPKETRTYDDNILIRPSGQNNLFLFNDVNTESYIAGVVQSEIYMPTDSTDIFKLQAIISRTYALKNINRHKLDGYNLCDDVHCQVYCNRCTKASVLKGAMDSRGEILMDSAGNMIDAPFHSNSGGYTANSEDVWTASVYYLRSVKDTFSTQMKNATWEKEISTNEWLSYFKKNYTIDVTKPDIRNELLNYNQNNERKSQICTVPLKQVRSDFRLRSTLFSVHEEDGKVKLSGSGYGHGVGLSQEGAIYMIQNGYSYKDVLLFYYRGICIVQVDEDSLIHIRTK